MKGEGPMAFNNIKPNAIDLFCGAGGLSLGLDNSNITVRLGVEISPSAANTYRNNHNLSIVIQNDVRNVTGIQILQQLDMKEGE